MKKILNLLKRSKQDQEEEQSQDETYEIDQTDDLDLLDDDNDEVGIGTKVKVIAALVVVAVATYVAYWVQEPTALKVNVFEENQPTAEETTPTVDEAEETLQDIIAETSYTSQADTDLNLNVQEVNIADFSFTPANMTVEEDTTVLWTNMDSVAHTVTAEDFSSGSLEPGDSYAYTFDKDGVFEYSCSFHPQMKGKITVVSAAASEFVDDEPFVPEETAPEETFVPEETLVPEETSPADSVEVTPTLLSFDEDVFDREDIKPAAAAAPDGVPTLEPIILEPEVAPTTTADAAAPAETPEEVLQTMDEDSKLAKSGPEDAIYLLAFIVIAYFNRKKLLKADR